MRRSLLIATLFSLHEAASFVTSPGTTPRLFCTSSLQRAFGSSRPDEEANFFRRLVSPPRDVREQLRPGLTIVPVIGARDGWSGIRRRLLTAGVYPGVEFVVEGLIDPDTGNFVNETLGFGGGASSPDDVMMLLRPRYPLVAHLERDWPVTIRIGDVPVYLTPVSYNVATAVASLATSVAFVVVGALLSKALTLSFILSRSMEPTLLSGDVVLVEKVSRSLLLSRGDVVFFEPPQTLREAVAEAGGTLGPRDLFVKRVVAVSGDNVRLAADGAIAVNGRTLVANGRVPASSGCDFTVATVAVVDADGAGLPAPVPVPLPESVLRRLRPGDAAVPADAVYAIGDNAAASVDSRVWGPLPRAHVVGHPLLRVWPLSRFGAVR